MTSDPANTPDAIPPSRRKILVVGATGFLGSKILQRLIKDASADVRAMSRRQVASDGSAVEWVIGDMLDRPSLDRAMAEVDVVVSSANGYMKETIEADFHGNRNLIEAAARAGVKRFVFLSVVACDTAPEVPHFHAKKVAEDLIRSSGIGHVIIRAPAFLDQSSDYVADGVKAGRFYAVGDKTTRWSYVITDDLADCLAKAATYPGEDIMGQTIDIGWRDGAKNQRELADLITSVTGRKLSLWTIPWFVFRTVVRPVKLFSELGYDLIRMFLFFRTGRFVADVRRQEQFFGPTPTAKDAVTRWAAKNNLIK